ncbi:hypothetical protein AB9P05_02790 [Roseivirga sp. BDSF3-8]|uniref:hypothetical protein n=1 Tax=Roseivirga sp. BDSF3-8 TaxID=3241598 RepID=UPI0035321379
MEYPLQKNDFSPPSCPVCDQYELLRHVVDQNDYAQSNKLWSSTLGQYRQIREKIEDHKRDQLESIGWLLLLISGIVTVLAVALQQGAF